jgi:hypothetical protein
MNALVWRLHRNQAFVAGVTLAVLAAVLLVTGLLISGDYHNFLSSCGSTHSCSNTSQLFSNYGLVKDLVLATMAVPLLFGLFWGAPLLAKEFEEGTHSLAWTQGVTRRRWLVTTLAWVLLASAVWGGAMAALVSWWRIPMNAIGMPNYRLSPSLFDVQGIVPVAYSVFAVAVGIAAGAVWRRVLPAMATAVALFIAVRVIVADYLRPHYLAPLTKTVSLFGGGGAIKVGGAPSGSWLLSHTMVGPNGQTYGGSIGLKDIPAVCQQAPSPSCLAAHGYHQLLTYQPASRFWAFQGIETAIFVVLAAILVAVTYRLVMTRDA